MECDALSLPTHTHTHARLIPYINLTHCSPSLSHKPPKPPLKKTQHSVAHDENLDAPYLSKALTWPSWRERKEGEEGRGAGGGGGGSEGGEEDDDDRLSEIG